MMYAIYKLTAKAMDEGMTWDDAFDNDEIEIVEEFETMEECEKAWNAGPKRPIVQTWYDDEIYGYGALNPTTYIF